VSRLPDGSYVIEGVATIRDLRERMGLPLEESSEYQTVAGFVMHRIGSVPRPGMMVVAGGYRWTVVSMDGPRIIKIKAERDRP
jgi:putative hemolysin